jgi:hypothetical protein
VFIRVLVSASLGYPTSATSYGWELQKSKTIPRYQSPTTKSPELIFSSLEQFSKRMVPLVETRRVPSLLY